ncbi:hypothetical protein E1B28_006953 [Marasmius oreades]|uniref:F-box domain-containing protein n=1 Tax=Marasmius oreades TaxID=181124 RepID=A0A9P7S0X5_9AGAR|nr:uncharacterized protein E1B28_006953 [Marasmius oreades]KAG7093270.1 hypothetical protein E1B28_006953 [Marasmius oreades]
MAESRSNQRCSCVPGGQSTAIQANTMSKQQSNNISTHRDVHRPILCHRCRHVVDTPNIRPLHTIEPRFLRNDYIPSKVEMSELKDLLKEGERELKRYEVDMALLQQTLERPGNAKSVVETRAKQCRAAISAQRRVPVEMWEMIFSKLCLSLCEYSFDVTVQVAYRSDSPLLGLPATIISQVCRDWRTIAKGLPKLWSSITVNLSNPSYNIGSPLEVYFSNSGDYPLKLRIVGAPPLSESSRGLDLWNSSSRHIHRSRELTMVMDVNRAALINFLPPGQRLTFPNLESYREERATPAWPWFRQAIQKSPKLAVFSSYRVNRAIPSPQLTSWEVRRIWRSTDVDNFLDVARSCKALKFLTLSCIRNLGTRRNLPVTVREVNLPSLRQLLVRTYRDKYSWLLSIFGSLVMPSLERCFIRHCTWLLPSTLVDMVRRSSISLKQITLELFQDRDPNSCRDPLLLDMLQAAPKLTRFELTLGIVSSTKIRPRTAFVDDMVSALLSKFEDGPPDFLPQLDYLSLELPFVTLDTQLVKRILEVVAARQRAPHPFSEFRLVRIRYGTEADEYDDFVMGPELLERIRVLKESGVKVVVEDRHATRLMILSTVEIAESPEELQDSISSS